jgi:hypothetical protein
MNQLQAHPCRDKRVAHGEHVGRKDVKISTTTWTSFRAGRRSESLPDNFVALLSLPRPTNFDGAQVVVARPLEEADEHGFQPLAFSHLAS